jgi:hypothetical protein
MTALLTFLDNPIYHLITLCMASAAWCEQMIPFLYGGVTMLLITLVICLIISTAQVFFEDLHAEADSYFLSHDTFPEGITP